MNAPNNLPAHRQSRELHPVAKLTQQLQERAAEFSKALPAHISPEKLQRTIVTAATSNPDLLTADRQSLIVAAMKAAQDGLLPDGREAALVIFNTSEKDAQGNWQRKKLCQYMPMVYGLRKKIVQSGEIASLQTGLVYRAEMEAGAFLYEVGLEPPIRHRPMLDLPAEELTDDKIVAAYSMAKMKDGTVSVEVMRRGEIDKVREVSMTGATKDKKGNARSPKGPWVDWFGEMARKTVMRRHSKTLPMSGDIIVDVEANEIEAASRAAALLDAVQPDAPVALPSRDELVDAETGEVMSTDSRGMTDVDEETARALDANDGTLSSDNPTAAEGPDDSQRGEQTLGDALGDEIPALAEQTQAEAAAQTLRDIDGPLEQAEGGEDLTDAQKKAQEIARFIPRAKTMAQLKRVEAEYLKHCIAMDRSDTDQIEAALVTRKRELAKD